MKEQRLKAIENYVKTAQAQSCSLDELKLEFNVSLNTIRRDVRKLVDSGSLKKVYGGVTINSNSIYGSTISEQDEDSDTNKKIATLAVELIEDGDIIYLGSGSTVAQLVPLIKRMNDITVVTNSILVITQLVNNKQVKLMVIGGDYDYHSQSFIGSTTLESLNNINFHKSFISSNGVSIKGGMTNSTSTEAQIKRLIVSRCPCNILLADQSKFNKTSLYTIIDMNDLNIICTDKMPDYRIIDFCNTHEIKILNYQNS